MAVARLTVTLDGRGGLRLKLQPKLSIEVSVTPPPYELLLWLVYRSE